jgi:hypothetical protein
MVKGLRISAKPVSASDAIIYEMFRGKNMGIVRMGPPEEVILLMKKMFNLSTFIETGTFEGGTAIWASKHFKNVLTIENSKTLYDQVMEKNKHIRNIEFLFGNSTENLKQIVPKLDKTVIFWLDAHWCGGDSYGEKNQCPILQELETIIKSGIPHCILIDDARLFLSPPPLPNKIDQWPTIDRLLNKIQSGSEQYYIVISEDVIIAVPIFARVTLAKYLQSLNTKLWQEQGEVPHKTGLRLMIQGARLFVKDIGSKLLRAVCIWRK